MLLTFRFSVNILLCQNNAVLDSRIKTSGMIIFLVSLIGSSRIIAFNGTAWYSLQFCIFSQVHIYF